jgi:hypothetical protein
MRDQPRPTFPTIALAIAVLLAAVVISSRTFWGPEGPTGVHEPEARSTAIVAEVNRDAATAREPFGQFLYVPAYSSIYASDKNHAFNLAVTLSVRNTDAKRPIVITEVRYYDRDGRLIRDFLKKPLRIGPLASLEFFIEEKQTRGASTGFRVEWVSEQAVSEPVVEALMMHTGGSQGVSFLCPGRVLADRSRPKPETPRP